MLDINQKKNNKTTKAARETERIKWIKGLIQMGKENPVELEEDEITLDKNIKKQLFKERYCSFTKATKNLWCRK